MRAIWPGQLGRVEMHQTRTGGDLSHIRPGRTHLNQFLIGGPEWRDELEESIRRASELNHRHAYSARRWTRKRKKEAQKIKRRGPQDPWKKDRSEGPLREFVFTANKKHFESAVPGFSDTDKEEMFRKCFLEASKERFGGACVAAWEDHDEEGYHIHGVIAPWVTSESKQAGKQRTLVPSSIPVIKNYEAGHDIFAEHFKSAGLVRGERRAEARREAFAAEGKSELPRENIPCHEWRAAEAVRVHEQRKKAVRAWVAARQKKAAADETRRRAEAIAKQNAEAEQRREKKHAARIADIEAAEKRQTERQVLFDKRERDVAFREDRAEVTVREQNAFARLLLSVEEPIRKAAKFLGLDDHPLVKSGMKSLEELRERVGGFERAR